MDAAEPRDESSSRWRIDTQAGLLDGYDATVGAAHRYAYRLTGDRPRAEDLVQEVYLDLLRSARAGTVREVGVGRVVLAVRHRFLDQIRSATREERRLRLVWWPAEATPIDGDDPLGNAGLSDRERAALTLRYIDDLRVGDVAEELGISVRATESLLARAKARMRKAGP